LTTEQPGAETANIEQKEAGAEEQAEKSKESKSNSP